MNVDCFSRVTGPVERRMFFELPTSKSAYYEKRLPVIRSPVHIAVKVTGNSLSSLARIFRLSADSSLYSVPTSLPIPLSIGLIIDRLLGENRILLRAVIQTKIALLLLSLDHRSF